MTNYLTITKELLKEIKQARSLGVLRDREGNGAMTLHFEDNVRGTDVRTHKNWLCKVYFKSYRQYDYETERVYFERDPEESTCWASVSIYWDQRHHAASVLGTLKVGDAIAFEFIGNAGNLYAAAAGLHHDKLILIVKHSNGKTQEWELDESICPANSARMVRTGGLDRVIDKHSYDYQNREPITEESEIIKV